MSVTEEVFHPLMSPLKSSASKNIASMEVTLLVSHPLMSPLKYELF